MNTKQRILLYISVIATLVASVVGCSGDDIPVSPNAKTAAPARLPGEDPHAPPDRVVAHRNMK